MPLTAFLWRASCHAQNMPAMDAYWKEWGDLEKKEFWKWDTLCEWDDTKRWHARPENWHPKHKDEVHFGLLFG